MRDNQPVTQQEFPVPEGATLMSTTDLDSRIVYANSAFTRISGFEAAELAGQAHNLVRHPDMPRQAFADMWATLKSGQSWSALVKNRRKDGDHYWVRAHATVLRSDGRVRGYMSVRTRAEPAEAHQAETLYRRLRQGQLQGWRFRQGLLVRSGALRHLSAWRWLSLRARLGLGLGGAAALAALPAGLLGLSPLAMGAGLALAGAALALYLQAQVLGPVQRIAAQAARVASGQAITASELGRVDELGLLMRSVNQSGLNLRALVDDVADQVERLEQASEEVRVGGDDLSRRSEQAAEQLRHASGAIGELGRSCDANAQAARQVQRLAEGAAAVAQQGGAAMQAAVAEMEGLSHSSRRIADIVATMDGLAFQTNVLALNASVEAARAGVSGRGFAVVAQEVRALSQRSAQAAREIRQLIEVSLAGITAGCQRVDQAGQTSADILGQVKEVSRLVGEIAAVSGRQAAGVQQVHADLAGLEGLTQQNVALVEQSAAAAAELNQRAQRLGEAVAVYRER